ncbi:MAG: carboxypeptidase-like regulatory domain-containing protein [Bacteroidota bacterium]
MKKAIIIIILIAASLQTHSQELKGIVLDNNTKQPLSNVSVFFNGTTIGTITDRQGNFKLDAPADQKFPVAISAIGYNSVLLTDYTSDRNLIVFLIPKIYELDEVVVTSKRSFFERTTRNYNLNTFKRQFLGETVNAYNCRILNESEIIFQYDNEKLMLTAYAPRSLIISNKSLGYNITFYLDFFRFTQTPYSLTYAGYYIFSEDSTLGIKEVERAHKRRRLAYMGSRMHLMRSLWENTLDSSGFIIKNSAGKSMSYDSLVVGMDSADKYLGPGGVYDIAYFSKIPSSTFEITEDSVFFNRLGYFDPFRIKWTGGMSRQRVADLLPFDYVLK